MSKVNIGAVENLVKYAPYFGKDLVSLKKIREQQDPELVKEIRAGALEKLKEGQFNEIEGSSFFLGSADFMVHKREDGKEFSIIETNGGSSRGLSALHTEGWELTYDGLLETLRLAGDDPLVLIGHPNNDMLLHEKIFLAENFQRNAELELHKNGKPKSGEVILSSYSEILPKLDLKGNVPYFKGSRVNVMIGDGIVRRKEEFEKKGRTGELDAVFANEIFPETDDKGLTYRAVKEAADDLDEFRVYPLDYWRARDEEELMKICRESIEEGTEVVIKPYGGSGGSGIDMITDEEGLENRIRESFNNFHTKFTKSRDPFPYTICEKVNFRPITWKDSERNYDIRIYVARKGNELIPVGGLARIALKPFSGKVEKKSFVVNLSGYEGLDVSRGLAISKEGLKTLKMTKEDFIDMFAASVTLFKYIVESHEDIIGDWESCTWKK